MSKVQPFDTRDNFTRIHNYVIDHIMPTLKPNAFKLLMLIIRKTKGWGKDADRLSYSQLREGTGMKSDATLSAAIDELVSMQYITVENDDKWSANNYVLNTTLEIEVDSAPTSKTVVDTTSKTVAGSTTETVDTKETYKEKEDIVEPTASTPTNSGEGESTEQLETAEYRQWFEAICWLVHRHKDYSLLSKIDRIAIGKTVKSIRASKQEYTIDDLRAWYKNVWSNEWPGKQQGKAEIQPPTLKQIKVGIGKVRQQQTPVAFVGTPKPSGVIIGTVENLR